MSKAKPSKRKVPPPKEGKEPDDTERFVKLYGTKKRLHNAIRKIYAWHLLPPFDKSFDRTHWWDSADSGIELSRDSALYELLRRHPSVGEHLPENSGRLALLASLARRPSRRGSRYCLLEHLDLPPLPRRLRPFLIELAKKPWPELKPDDQNHWRHVAGKIKGFDCRQDTEKCFSLAERARTDIRHQREKQMRMDPIRRLMLSRTEKGRAGMIADDARVDSELAELRFTSKEMEEAVASAAVSAYKEGHLLVAIASKVGVKDVERLVSSHLQQTESRESPAQFEKWLKVIAEFERDWSRAAESQKIAVTDQVFARYRRIIDGVRF